MVTTGSFITLRNVSSGMLQVSPAEDLSAGRDAALDENATEPAPEDDCYIPSAQRLSEMSLQNCVAAQPTEIKDDKKNMFEEFVKTTIEFFKAPANLYMHKKSTDEAVNGNFDRMKKIEDVKADYNRRYDPAPVRN